MSIVANEILVDSPLGYGRKAVEARFQDHVGVWHKRGYTGPIADTAAFLTSQEPIVEGELQVSEVTDALKQAELGNDPDKSADHQPQADFDRRLLGLLMQELSIDTKIAAIPFWLAVETRGGANANQRAAYLGVTRPEYDLVSAMFGDLQGVSGGVDTVNGQIWDEQRDAWL